MHFTDIRHYLVRGAPVGTSKIPKQFCDQAFFQKAGLELPFLVKTSRREVDMGEIRGNFASKTGVRANEVSECSRRDLNPSRGLERPA